MCDLSCGCRVRVDIILPVLEARDAFFLLFIVIITTSTLSGPPKFNSNSKSYIPGAKKKKEKGNWIVKGGDPPVAKGVLQ